MKPPVLRRCTRHSCYEQPIDLSEALDAIDSSAPGKTIAASDTKLKLARWLKPLYDDYACNKGSYNTRKTLYYSLGCYHAQRA